MGFFYFKILGFFIKIFNRLEKMQAVRLKNYVIFFLEIIVFAPSPSVTTDILKIWLSLLMLYVFLISSSLDVSHQSHFICSFQPFPLTLHLTPIIQYCHLALRSPQYRRLGLCFKDLSYSWWMSALAGDYLFFQNLYYSIQYYACAKSN